MLQSIRERAQGVIAAVIVAILCLTFAIWGIESYLESAHKVIVAKIGGDAVELAEYQATFQRLRQRAQAELGETFDSKLWATDATKQKALDYVIEDRLLQNNVDRARLRIGAGQVAGYLKGSPTFQVDGKFSHDRYTQVTRTLGFTEQSFEHQTRKDLAIQQLRVGVSGSSFVTEQEAQHIQQLKAQQRSVAYALIEPADLSKESVADDTIKTYYEKNKERYRTEEKISTEYIQLALDDLKKTVVVDDKAVHAYYAAHQPDFTVDEQRNANHILVQVKTGATPAEDAAAKVKAITLRELVVSGTPFEQVAKENSDDIGSRAEGGATGLFGRGVMAPEFEQAVFTMKVGDLSQPVKTSFGYHIIKLKEIKPGGVKPFADVSNEVEAKYRTEQAENAYYETSERFSDTVLEHPDSLADAASKLGLTVATGTLQTRAQIAAQFSESVADAAWETEVLAEGLATPPIEIGANRIVALRVTKHQASKIPALADVKTEITAAIQQDQARVTANERGTRLVQRLRKGEAAATVMSAEKLKWETHQAIDRQNEDINRAVLRAAFKAPVVGAHPTYLGVELGTGSFAVIEVANPSMPTLDKLDGGAVKAVQRDVARGKAFVEWRDFMSTLRGATKVEAFPKNL